MVARGFRRPFRGLRLVVGIDPVVCTTGYIPTVPLGHHRYSVHAMMREYLMLKGGYRS